MTENSAVRHFQQGFSLIELLIALALGLAVLVGFSSVFVVAKQSFRFQETTGRLQEDGTFALNSIARDLRMAGYAGCAGINKTVVGLVTTYFPASVLQSGNPDGINGVNPLATFVTTTEVTTQPFTPDNFIRGFDSVPSGMFATGAVPVAGATDSLFFAGGSAKAVALRTLMPNSNSPLELTVNPYKWSNPTTNPWIYDLIVSNCDTSYMFKGTVTGSGSAGTASVAHSTPGNTSVEFTTGPITIGATTTETRTQFGNDAIVMPVEWNFYYIATRTGASTPSLYRVFFDGNIRGAPEEIVSNVESMQLHYGENTNPTTLVANVWRTCASGPASATCDPVIDWSRVVAVRIGLMMISAEDNANPDVVWSAPTLLGLPYSIPAGASTNRLRKEFSSTVVLRNRVKWQ